MALFSAAPDGPLTTQSDGVDAPRRHRRARVEVLKHHSKEASVGEVTTIGLDLAKHIFQAHGADASGGHCQMDARTRYRLFAHFVLFITFPISRREGGPE
jgi:hypothetical protein